MASEMAAAGVDVASGDTAEIIGDERGDGALLVLDRVGAVARLRRQPAEGPVVWLNGPSIAAPRGRAP
eukprot:657709-Prymnesium_polylepis.1